MDIDATGDRIVETVKTVKQGKITYTVESDENGAGDVSYYVVKWDSNGIGEYDFRNSFRDKNKAIYLLNKLVRKEIAWGI
jgi:hypothetical protein